MKIDRHNYEEFFLMYVDNELQQDERCEVEDFVKHNPDLADELTMLQQATLSDENIEFTGKNLLYKKEEGISMSNYEEYFLLSVDNELNQKDSDKVEKFVLKHPELQEAFTLIQKVKLEPEQISCPDKEDLYKSEKTRRVIPIMWMRMSVAAAILGLIATLWMFNNNVVSHNGQNNTIALKNQVTIVTEKIIEKLPVKPVTQSPVESLQNKSDNKQEVQLASVTTRPIRKVQKGNATRPTQTDNNTALPSPEPALMARKNQMITNNNNEEQQNIALNSSKNNESLAVLNENKGNSVATLASNKAEDKVSIVSNATFHEVDTNEDDRKVYIGGAAFNKNKIKGLFKKAAAIFGKNVSKDDEDKTVNVASFEIKGI